MRALITLGIMATALLMASHAQAQTHVWRHNFDFQTNIGNYTSGHWFPHSNNTNTGTFGHSYRPIRANRTGGGLVSIPINYTHHAYDDADNDILITIPPQHIGLPSGNFGRAVNRRPRY